MATAAQLLANQANAQHSTGPRTPEGKARSSRNSFQHGLTLGVLAIADEEIEALNAFIAEMRADLFPVGALQEEAFQQFLDGAFRLRKIRILMDEMAAGHADDPFIRPECAPKIHALMRHRATAEMLVYRSLQTLRELQTTALYRAFHLTPEEDEVVPPTVQLGEKILILSNFMHVRERRMFYNDFGHKAITERFRPEVVEAVRNAGRAAFQ
jgi:hypothetical protein